MLLLTVIKETSVWVWERKAGDELISSENEMPKWY